LKYFVTGATGFIGGRVARQLVAAGHSVIALARDPARASDLTSMGVTVAPGDVTDKESMRAPMRGVDAVYHIAGWYKVGAKDKRPGIAINVEGTRNVLELMRELDIPKGVYTSTLSINSDTHGRLVDETYRYEGPHNSEYDRTKWLAHFEVAVPMIQAGLPLVIVMPGAVYGPGDTSQVGASIRLYLKRTLFVSPARTAFSWGHVDDIAHAHRLAMDLGKPGQTYIIAGPTHTLIDMLALAERVAGVPAPRIHPGPGMMRFFAAMSALGGRFLPLPELFQAESLRSLAGVTYIGDNSKAKRELGYAPRPLDAGLPEAVEYEIARSKRTG
jgi:nucleoside-diphosphate-sugar epimerase